MQFEHANGSLLQRELKLLSLSKFGKVLWKATLPAESYIPYLRKSSLVSTIFQARTSALGTTSVAGTPVPPKRGGRDEEEHTNHIEVLLQSYLMGSNYGKLLFSNKKFSFVCMLKILLFLKKWPALSHLEGKFILHSYFHRRHSTHTSILTSIYFHLNIMKFRALRSGT